MAVAAAFALAWPNRDRLQAAFAAALTAHGSATQLLSSVHDLVELGGALPAPDLLTRLREAALVTSMATAQASHLAQASIFAAFGELPEFAITATGKALS
jgi:hypothetical protein